MLIWCDMLQCLQLLWRCRIHFNWTTSEKTTEHAKNNQHWFDQFNLIDSLGQCSELACERNHDMTNKIKQMIGWWSWLSDTKRQMRIEQRHYEIHALPFEVWQWLFCIAAFARIFEFKLTQMRSARMLNSLFINRSLLSNAQNKRIKTQRPIKRLWYTTYFVDFISQHIQLHL